MINLSNKQQKVLQIIREYPEAANDDAILFDRYWHEIDGWDDTKSLYWNLTKCTRAETITRRRRELYNLGLITYSDEKLKDREEAFTNERERAAQVASPQYEAVSWLND